MRSMCSLQALAIAAVLMGTQLRALAQCSMCRQAAESSPQFASAINTGILILLIPAVVLFCGVYAVAFRYHGSERTDEEE